MILLSGRLLRDESGDLVCEVGGLDRLLPEDVEAAAAHARLLLEGAEYRQRQRGHFRLFAKVAEEFAAVDVGQDDVADDDIGLPRLYYIERIRRTPGGMHL